LVPPKEKKKLKPIKKKGVPLFWFFLKISGGPPGPFLIKAPPPLGGGGGIFADGLFYSCFELS